MKAFNVVDIGSFGIQVCQFAHKRRIPIITSSFQSRCLNLSHNPNLVACRHKPLNMNMQSVNGYTRRSKTIDVGFGGIYTSALVPSIFQASFLPFNIS